MNGLDSRSNWCDLIEREREREGYSTVGAQNTVDRHQLLRVITLHAAGRPAPL